MARILPEIFFNIFLKVFKRLSITQLKEARREFTASLWLKNQPTERPPTGSMAKAKKLKNGSSFQTL
jgi:hypothetical protein